MSRHSRPFSSQGKPSCSKTIFTTFDPYVSKYPMLWPFPPRYLTCPLTRLPMYVKSSLVNVSLTRENENISRRFLIHFDFCVIFLQYATFELLPRFFSSFSPGLEQLTREIVRKWNCHFIYFRNLFHFCLILQHHLEKTMLKLCIHSPHKTLIAHLCVVSKHSMGLPPHLLNQITFEHEIQDTKFYGVSKMKTNSIY